MILISGSSDVYHAGVKFMDCKFPLIKRVSSPDEADQFDALPGFIR
ncbi:MAG: hypothetical protein ACHQFX_04110 [Chitinophagales bacterium]